MEYRWSSTTEFVLSAAVCKAARNGTLRTVLVVKACYKIVSMVKIDPVSKMVITIKL